MIYFTEVKIKVKILLHFAQYYLDISLLPLVFLVVLFKAIKNAFGNAYRITKQTYRSSRFHFMGF